MTFAQLTQPTPGILVAAPANGVITMWHVHGDTADTGWLALRVLRDERDGAGRLTAVATSAAVTASRLDGSPGHSVNIPVLAGDYIGVDATHPGLVYYTVPSGSSFGIWEGGFSDGSTGAPRDENGRLMLNAVESLQPAVSGLTPASGSVTGGETVKISGSNLDGATGVSFGGVPAQSFTAAIQEIATQTMTATAPPGAAGASHVQVTGPGGESPATGADLYSYEPPGVMPPSVALVSPANGATYKQGDAVAATYSCAAPAGATVISCTGPRANGGTIDTLKLGSHTFTVIAHDSDGGTATQSASYAIVATRTLLLSDAREKVKVWRENDVLPHISAKSRLPIGTTFSFALSEPATVTLSFTHQAAGRITHRKCVGPSAKNRHNLRCTRTIPAGTLTFTGHRGTNKVRFAGRTSPTNKLRPGRYTLRIIASNAQRERSAARRLTFTIAK